MQRLFRQVDFDIHPCIPCFIKSAWFPYNAGSVVNYGISNTIVLDIP